MEPLDLLTPESAPQVARLAIEGMTCGGCAAKVRRTLEALPGVVAVLMDLPGGAAMVGYDPQAQDAAAIVAAVRGLDYGASLVSEHAGARA